MTVESIARKAGPYEFTEGASYPFYFKIFEKTDVYVVVTDDTGVETTIEADTDYRVVMNENQDNDAGGYVTLLQDYTGSKITISSQVPYDQGVNITNKGGFYPSTLNKAYDKLTILCQQLLEQVSRCIKVNISSGVSADEYKDELEGLVNQSVSSAASAAASAQQAAADSAQAVSDSATALSRSTTALTQSGTALSQSTTALSQSTDAVNSIQPALSAAQQASNDAAEAVTKSEQALAETAAIDSKVEQAVNDAISGVTIPGLTPETIAGALGYTPYNAETNSKDFATNAEVAEAIEAIPEQVNADWNASKGAAAILNKPSTIAGYGIVDAYTKTQVDTKIAKKDCLPTQTGQTGKYLSTDGETPYWEKVDTGAMEVVEVETSGETTTLDIAPGKAYFLTRNGEYAFEGSVLEINSLPEKNNLRESSIWFDTQGQSVTIQINVEHKIVDAIPETEPYSHYVISIMGNTLIMQEMEKKPV